MHRQVCPQEDLPPGWLSVQLPSGAPATGNPHDGQEGEDSHQYVEEVVQVLGKEETLRF